MSFAAKALDQHLIIAISAALALAGCAKKKEEPVAEAPAAAPAAAAPDTTLEGQVDIIAWPGYLERGETDKNYDWVTGFETDTGCKVNRSEERRVGRSRRRSRRGRLGDRFFLFLRAAREYERCGNRDDQMLVENLRCEGHGEPPTVMWFSDAATAV